MRAWGIALLTGAALSLAWLFLCLTELPGWMPAIFFAGELILYPAVAGVCLLRHEIASLAAGFFTVATSPVKPEDRIRPLRFER